jgi:hypothetical protein
MGILKMRKQINLEKRNPSRHKGMSNLNMDNKVYLLRRKVIDMIYEINNEIIRLPRLNVRVTNDSIQEGILGVGSMNNDYIIWIPLRTFDLPKGDFRSVVYHEVLHSAYKIGHSKDKKSLMYPEVRVGLTKQQVQSLFIKELKKKGIM